MLSMVAEINRRLDTLPMHEHEGSSVQVTCMTCHRGVTRPVPLETLMQETATAAGADSAIRMYRALRGALRRHRAAILIGTDCPALTPSDLRRAARLLRGNCDVVLAPAEDGGYALIGVRKASAALFCALFRGIAWGGPDVYSETVRKLALAGYRWRVLRTVWDLDRPADLERFASLRLRLASARLRLGVPRLRSRRSS